MGGVELIYRAGDGGENFWMFLGAMAVILLRKRVNVLESGSVAMTWNRLENSFDLNFPRIGVKLPTGLSFLTRKCSLVLFLDLRK